MLELFCVAATEADTSNPLSRKLLLQMVLALGNTEIPLGLLAHLSKEQLRVYVDISCTRWRRGKGFMSCLGNYHRLRLIILWCAGAVSTEAAQALAPYLPGSESKLMLLYETEGANNFHARERPEPYVPDEECGPLLQKESVKTCVSECQDLLQLHKVPLHLLAIIIEPLDIVHFRIMCDAYRRQALRGEMSVLRWDTGFWGSQYRCRARGFVLESTEGAIKRYYEDHGRGFARTSICTATDAGACAWEFVVEEWCEGIQLGFYSNELGELDDDDGETYLFFELSHVGWALTEKGLTDHEHLTDYKTTYRDYDGQAHLRKNSRVKVHVENNTSSFIIDGINYGVAWENIPCQVFPACTLGHPGRVRIQNVII